MARTPATFKQADLTRAVKAAQACGLNVKRTEIRPDGTIVLDHSAEIVSAASPFDEWKAKRQ